MTSGSYMGKAYNSANISGKKAYILAVFFALRKKYRKYLRYILQSAKKTAKNYGIFCGAQKILQKISQKQTKKIYDNRKYLRYFLRIAKISVKISDIFCKSQKIPQKILQKKPKKTFGSYMISEAGSGTNTGTSASSSGRYLM